MSYTEVIAHIIHERGGRLTAQYDGCWAHGHTPEAAALALATRLGLGGQPIIQHIPEANVVRILATGGLQ